MLHRIGGIFKGAGLLLLLLAAALFAYNCWDAGRADEAARCTLEKMADRVPATDPEDMKDCGSSIKIDGEAYIGILSIPCLDLELPVMANWSYEGLKIAPGRYSGCVWTADLVLAAHNYERHFGGLRTLKIGDEVSFTTVFGQIFSYEVALMETLAPDEEEKMTAGDWPLTLFTCTTGVQSRVTVRCELL